MEREIVNLKHSGFEKRLYLRSHGNDSNRVSFKKALVEIEKVGDETDSPAAFFEKARSIFAKYGWQEFKA